MRAYRKKSTRHKICVYLTEVEAAELLGELSALVDAARMGPKFQAYRVREQLFRLFPNLREVP